MSGQPWASGPREILQHGLSLLREDSDKHRRLALLSIDNAVELTVKTFLGLPKRISGIEMSRREYAEISESFPRLIDALESHAANRIEGVNLGEIEWFHRLRNQLYHQGNGLTVEREKVEIYAELARLLFQSLFEDELEVPKEDQHQRLGAFLAAWVDFERTVARLSEKNKDRLSTLAGRPRPPMLAIRELISVGIFSPEDARTIEELRRLRNEVVHGMVDYHVAVTREIVEQLRTLTQKYQEAS